MLVCHNLARETGVPFKTNLMSKQDNRTTVLVAVLTFVGLSLLTLVAWALTRTPGPAPASEAALAQPAAPAPEAAAAQTVASAPVAPAEDHNHPEDFERIAFGDFKKQYDAGEIVVIDVRSMDQFIASHIPGSLHIPVARIEGEIPYLPKGKTIVTYCTCPAEESSGQAAMILAHGGIPAKALVGGLEAWTKAGLPLGTGVK